LYVTKRFYTAQQIEAGLPKLAQCSSNNCLTTPRRQF